MKPKSATSICLLSAASILCTFVAPSHAKTQSPFRPASVIFKVSENVTPRELKGLNGLLKGQGLISQKTLKGSKISVASFQHSGREKAIATILAKSGYVEFAQPDYIVDPVIQPNDPSFSNQWHHDNINSQQAWEVTTGNNVLVAVCDSGFDVNHPDLGANLRTDLAYNANDGSDYIFDANGHGTGTAGSLGAVGNNAIGVAGVNWNIDIIPIRIAISDSNSSAYISTMANCIEYAADNGAKIVNLSYGGIQYAAIDSAAKYLRSKGGLLFMSAGNDGQEFPTFPDYTSFIGVGATDQNNNRANFSSFGTYIDLTAPGVSIRTTYPDNRYINYNGTSFSSPIAAGVAALMVAANPSITPDEIEAGLFSTALDIGANGDDNVFGHGLVDAAAAVNYANNLGSSSSPVALMQISSTSIAFGNSISVSGLDSYDIDGDIVSYAWDLGDNTTSAQSELTHTYASAGSYQVNLTVTDNEGLTNTSSQIVQVTTAIPDAVITQMQTTYAVGESIIFDGSASSDIDGNIAAFEWDFGDSNTASTMSPSHTYAAAGEYLVTLTVTDNAGAQNATTIQIVITDPLEILAPTNLSAQTQGLTVLLTWSDNNNNEASFSVERGEKFRGKVRYQTLAVLPENTTNFTDALASSGDYQYRVTAANSANQATSSPLKVTVNNDNTPQPNGLEAPTNLSANLTVDGVALSWSDNSEGEVGFYIEQGIKQKGKITFSQIAVVAKDISQYTQSTNGLPNGNYAYRVRAFNDNEVSSSSNTAEIRIK